MKQNCLLTVEILNCDDYWQGTHPQLGDCGPWPDNYIIIEVGSFKPFFGYGIECRFWSRPHALAFITFVRKQWQDMFGARRYIKGRDAYKFIDHIQGAAVSFDRIPSFITGVQEDREREYLYSLLSVKQRNDYLCLHPNQKGIETLKAILGY